MHPARTFGARASGSGDDRNAATGRLPTPLLVPAALLAGWLIVNAAAWIGQWDSRLFLALNVAVLLNLGLLFRGAPGSGQAVSHMPVLGEQRARAAPRRARPAGDGYVAAANLPRVRARRDAAR
jgi:hypothetical protein